MIPTTYNKPASRQGSSIHGQVIAPVRDAACTDMNQDFLNECFDYNKDTGALTWRARPVHHFRSGARMKTWNTRYAGKKAGCPFNRHNKNEPNGVSVHLLGRMRYAHRIVWIMTNGDIPNGMLIDHINGNPLDNRIANLRLATPSQNSMNQRRSSRNKTGYKGVCHGNRMGPFRANIRINGKSKTIGYFDTAEEAYGAYCKRAVELFGEYAKLK